MTDPRSASLWHFQGILGHGPRGCVGGGGGMRIVIALYSKNVVGKRESGRMCVVRGEWKVSRLFPLKYICSRLLWETSGLMMTHGPGRFHSNF